MRALCSLFLTLEFSKVDNQPIGKEKFNIPMREAHFAEFSDASVNSFYRRFGLVQF